MVLRAFAITALLIVPGAVFAEDTCVQTRVTESFVSPDGKAHGPGVVKVCPYWTISPSFRLNKVSFNGMPLGIWMTRAREGGKLPDLNSIELRHLPDGRIALADHYWPGRDGRPVAPGLRTVYLDTPVVAEAPSPLAP